METKKIFAITLAMFSAVAFIVLFTASSLKASAQTDTISLNEKKEITLGYDEVKTFYCTLPTSEHYVVETFGSSDTVLRVSNIPEGEIINDGRFYSDNARVYFKGEANRQVKIEVRIYHYLSGKTTLQIRKQRFSMFGYVDGDGNSTLKDLKTPYDKFNGSFDCVKYENMSANYAKSNDERGLARINSEIFFFSGHGADDGARVVFYNNGSFANSISIYDNIDMSGTRVAMWAACESACETNGMSIARHAVVNGAEASVGFKYEINFSSSRTYTNKFFTELAKGATVYDAASKGAKAVIWAWDHVKDYVVYGRGEKAVTASTINAGTFSVRPQNYEYLREQLASGYICEPLGDNEYRYYEEINGYESCNYIDVTEENGVIVDIDDCRNNYDSVLEINENYLTMGVAESVALNKQNYRLRTEEEEHIVYYNFDGVMTPVKISYATYVNEYGNKVLEADCINLFNGERIDYATIS